MSVILHNPRLATDSRVATGRSGISTYSRSLRAAQLAVSSDALLIENMPHIPDTLRLKRWLRAIAPWSRGLITSSSGRLLGDDIFSLAQVWFDVHGRLMPLVAKGPPGLVHWSHPVPMRLVGWKNAYTIHDAIPLSHPELSRISSSRYRKLLAAIHREARRGGAITAVSHAAKREIVIHTGITPALIEVTGQSVSSTVTRSASLPAVLQQRGYLLACGSVENRKNCLRLAEAHRRSGLTVPLVFAGPKIKGEEALERALAEFPELVRLDDVADEEMATLIARADALVMVSLSEGFGLPVIEAMALGTPVLASDIAAIEEIAGGAALLVDPLDVDRITEGLRQIISDQPLRTELAKRGLRNASRFTVDSFAAKLSAFYGRLIAQGP